MNDSIHNDLIKVAGDLSKLSMRYTYELSEHEFIDSVEQIWLVTSALEKIIQAGLLTNLEREFWLKNKQAIDKCKTNLRQISYYEM